MESLDPCPNESKKRLFILDTNVLMHDPSALFRFMEHDIYLPMVVLEELDNHKKGLSDTARNVRQANRYLDQLITHSNASQMFTGIPLSHIKDFSEKKELPIGCLFFQNEELPMLLPKNIPGTKADNSILATALALSAKQPECSITVVSKDINLRIKAAVLGIHAEDYFNDKVMDDTTVMYKGLDALPNDFWETHGRQLESWQKEERTYYKISGPQTQQWTPNHCLVSQDDTGFEAIVRQVEGDCAYIEYAKDYRRPKNNVLGIQARNPEQNFALNVLLDPEIDFVTLVGAAGTGKTLLAMAAGLAQTIDTERYREIIVTRVTVPVGEDIGFLPGSEEEKMTPWMGAFMDNLEVLGQGLAKMQGHAHLEEDHLKRWIKIRSLNFMRGRTFLNKFIILDEAQNLTAKQMQTLVTRAGPGSKIICLGNTQQIDTPYLTESTSGLTYVVHQFKNWAHSAHIVLSRGERSRLADFANQFSNAYI